MIQVLTTCVHAQRQDRHCPRRIDRRLWAGRDRAAARAAREARGASPVIGVTRSAEKRALAEKIGADITFAGGEGAIDMVREADLGPRG